MKLLINRLKEMADQNQAQAQALDPGVQAFQNLRSEVANTSQALAAQRTSYK